MVLPPPSKFAYGKSELSNLSMEEYAESDGKHRDYVAIHYWPNKEANGKQLMELYGKLVAATSTSVTTSNSETAVKSEVKSDLGPEVKSEAKSDLRPEVKSEVKSEANGANGA